MKNLLKATLLIAILAAAALPAMAGTITIGPATPTADAIQIPTSGYFGPGPQSFTGTNRPCSGEARTDQTGSSRMLRPAL